MRNEDVLDVVGASNLTWLRHNTIFLTEHGSHAYGTSLPTSDYDYKGVAIPPKKYMNGFLERFEQAEWHHTPDMVIYDIRKFFKLASDCNPSIMEILYTDPSNHIYISELGKRLLSVRDQFLSKKAKFTYSGYAVSQLHKIQTHYKYLKNPPTHQPTREEFGLPEGHKLIPQDQLNAANDMIRKKLESWIPTVDELDEAQKIAFQEKLQPLLLEVAGASDLNWHAGRSLGFTDNFLELLDKERLYKNRKAEWQSYQTWLSTRNAARSELEAKFGYDTKHAMHLVRLMRMGKEILEGKGVVVMRPDAQELLDIRRGAWTYEALVEWADRANAELDVLYKTSKLPREPDRVELDKQCQSIVYQWCYE